MHECLAAQNVTTKNQDQHAKTKKQNAKTKTRCRGQKASKSTPKRSPNAKFEASARQPTKDLCCLVCVPSLYGRESRADYPRLLKCAFLTQEQGKKELPASKAPKDESRDY